MQPNTRIGHKRLQQRIIGSTDRQGDCLPLGAERTGYESCGAAEARLAVKEVPGNAADHQNRDVSAHPGISLFRNTSITFSSTQWIRATSSKWSSSLCWNSSIARLNSAGVYKEKVE